MDRAPWGPTRNLGVSLRALVGHSSRVHLGSSTNTHNDQKKDIGELGMSVQQAVIYPHCIYSAYLLASVLRGS